MPFDIAKHWYQRSLTWLSICLLPLAWLFHCLIAIRRFLYRSIFTVKPFAVPVIVVGNITIGGTGKTPFVIWLVDCLRAKGFKPGIVSRGYGGIKQQYPYLVKSTDTAEVVGDEALLLRQTGSPLVISQNRADAVTFLLANTDCDIVISDDGLQHYAMHRDMEIVMIDGTREFGNQQLIPAGPLREPLSRLNTVDFVVVNGKSINYLESTTMEVMVTTCLQLRTQQQAQLVAFKGRTVHAVAGIGNPENFFKTLEAAGINIIRHPFPDHYCYKIVDIQFNDDLPILMTEKDAVKCQLFADDRYWAVLISVKLEDNVKERMLQQISQLNHRGGECEAK